MEGIYQKAKTGMARNTINEYKAAIRLFQSIPGWKDADEQIDICQRKIEELKKKEEAYRLEAECQAEERRIAEEKRKKKIKRNVIIATPIACICIAFVIVLNVVHYATISSYYTQGQNALADGDYRTSVQMFMETKEYQDSADLIRSYNLQSISAGNSTTVGLKSDGTMAAVGRNYDGRCDVEDWTDIKTLNSLNQNQ